MQHLGGRCEHLPTLGLQCSAWGGEAETGQTPVLTCPVLLAELGTGAGPGPEGKNHVAGETGHLDTGQVFSGLIHYV